MRFVIVKLGDYRTNFDEIFTYVSAIRTAGTIQS